MTSSRVGACLCSLISIEGSDAGGPGGEAGQREVAATKLTVETVGRCALDELFADSKFLRAESLIELVKAVMWAGGPVMRFAAAGEHSDVAEVGFSLPLSSPPTPPPTSQGLTDAPPRCCTACVFMSMQSICSNVAFIQCACSQLVPPRPGLAMMWRKHLCQLETPPVCVSLCTPRGQLTMASLTLI